MTAMQRLVFRFIGASARTGDIIEVTFMFRGAPIRLVKNQAGATSIEYSLIAALLAVPMIFAFGEASKILDNELTKINLAFYNGGTKCWAASNHEEWSLENGLPDELAGSKC